MISVFFFFVGLTCGVYIMTQYEFRHWLKERSDLKKELEKTEHERNYWKNQWKNKYD
jgi:hypothetical protein